MEAGHRAGLLYTPPTMSVRRGSAGTCAPRRTTRFHPKGFSFAAARYEQDRFGGFEYQASLGTGLGWRFFDDPVTRLSAQLGVGYSRTATPRFAGG